MGQRVALIALATAAVVGLLGCGGSNKGKLTFLTGGTITDSECPSGGCAASGSHARITLTNDGVGPLRINQSDRAEIVSFAGQPTSEFRGLLYSGLGLPRVDALYYGCDYTTVKQSGRENGKCKTIFWLEAHTGRLVDFWTRDPRYVIASGVGVGTSTAAAERATHVTAAYGCGGAALRLLSNRTPFSGLVLWVSGSRPGPKARAIGGRITYIWLLGNDRAMELQC
jgi:hypothetical protein